MTTTLNLAKAPGHQVLAAAGKTILRPGGKAGTEILFTWANFQPGDTVLELAASFGKSAIQIAKRFDVCVVGVERNPDCAAQARENVQAAGLENRITIIEGDIYKLDKITEKFDYVLAEAILTMQSDVGKAQILSGIKDHLKPGGKFLAHEMILHDRESSARQSLAQSVRINVNPLSDREWSTALAKAGLTIQQHQTGTMGLLNLPQIIRDEGILRTVKLARSLAPFGDAGSLVKIAWNLLINPNLRQRVLTMRHSFQQHRDNIGYIVFVAL